MSAPKHEWWLGKLQCLCDFRSAVKLASSCYDTPDCARAQHPWLALLVLWRQPMPVPCKFTEPIHSSCTRCNRAPGPACVILYHALAYPVYVTHVLCDPCIPCCPVMRYAQPYAHHGGSVLLGAVSPFSLLKWHPVWSSLRDGKFVLDWHGRPAICACDSSGMHYTVRDAVIFS